MKADLKRRMKVTSIIYGIVTATSLAFNPSLAEPLDGQVVVDSTNKQWLFYSDGSPFFLAAPGDPEDFLYRGNRNSDGTRSGDQSALIAKIAGSGANGIYFQIIRSNGGDGDATHNPFIGNDPSLGLNQAILDQWDEWFTAMDDAGIVIYLFFYDDSARIWDTGGTVGDDEREFFESIVTRFMDKKHLIWVIGEEYAERYSAARVSALASIIRQADIHEHAIAVHKNNGTSFSEFATDPNIDQFSMQYNTTNVDSLHAGVLSAWNSSNGQYNINMSEATAWGSGTGARRKAWSVAMAGAYVMGLGMDIASTPLDDLRDLGRLREFMESTDFFNMEPRDDLADGNTTWVLADAGTSYIAYSTNAGTSLGLKDIQSGTYELRWLDTVTGESTTVESNVATGPATVSWSVPSNFGDEVALYALRTDEAPPSTTPKPPTDLSAE